MPESRLWHFTLTPLLPPKARRARIWAIALPIAGGMMSQNLLNLVDIGMVGRLGDTALAATGIGGFTSYLAMAFILGLSAGVQALAARRLGEGRERESAIPLNGGLILALILGIPSSLIMIAASPMAFEFLTSDPDVAAQGVPYLQVRLAGIVAVGMNYSFRGFLSAVHMTGVYFKTILVMHAINIFLNWVLIFGNLGAPELGAYGAGLATTISVYCGAAFYFLYALRHLRDKGFLHRLPSRPTLWQQFKISLPTALQQLFFSAGLVILVWIVSQIGTAEVAAINVLMTFNLTVLLPAFGIGLAAATLVGNALGRNDPDDAMRWGWDAARLTGIYGFTLGFLLIPFAKPLLALFLTNPETAELAYWPMILWTLVIGFDVMGMVLLSAFNGAGDTKRSMWISTLAQWGFYLPLAYVVGPVLGFGLLGIWLLNGIYRIGQAGLCAWHWRARKWTNISL